MVTTVPSYAAGVERCPAARRDDRDNLARTAARVPESDALVDCPTDRRWTYRELDAAVDSLALGLLGARARVG